MEERATIPIVPRDDDRIYLPTPDNFKKDKPKEDANKKEETKPAETGTEENPIVTES